MNRRRYLGVLGLGTLAAGCLDGSGTGDATLGGDDEDDDDDLPFGEPAPQLAISGEVATGFSYSEDDEVLIRITHGAGDEIELDELEFVFREEDEFVPAGEDDGDDEEDDPVATFSAETDWQSGIGSSSADEELVLRLNGEEIEAGDTFVVDDTLTIEIGPDADDAALETLDDGADHEVLVVHEPSDADISISSVLLPPADD